MDECINRGTILTRVDEITETNHLRPDQVWFTPNGVKALAKDIPAADVKPVRHAYWVKRMEYGVGRGYEVHTPTWSCSNCGRDYDPASCSIIKYCYICGAKMDGGRDE